jgi:hypothetical protein
MNKCNANVGRGKHWVCMNAMLMLGERKTLGMDECNANVGRGKQQTESK